MKRKNVVLLALVGFVAFLSGGWLLQRGSSRSENVYQQARLFDDVVQYVSDYYVDSIGESHLYDLAIDGLLKELHDPYTTFLRPKDFKELNVLTTGNYGGLGIRIEVADGWITVVAPLPGTPAERAGIESGDRVVDVDGTSTHDWTVDHAVNELRGRPGSKVSIMVARPGVPDPIKFDLVREQVHVKSIQYATVLPSHVGYVALSTVSKSSADELHDAVTQLRSQGARSLILDIRGNPGGLLNEGVGLADLFLNSGQTVVETRGRAPDANETLRAKSAQPWPNMPLVVLVNGATASAAEIVAGALQDHDRALILGTLTFGKGLVQSLYQLGPQLALKMTTARWYTPAGRRLERFNGPGHTVLPGDSAAMKADSAAKDSAPIFHTDDGRIVYGGGGIRPDLIVNEDSLSAAERLFARTLGAKIPDYLDAMTSYALDIKAKKAVTSRNFHVTGAMRAELLRRLRAKGVVMPDSIWRGAANLISERLGDVVTRYVFGRDKELLRQIDRDPQVKKAASLLRQATSPKELLTLAAEAPKEPAPHR